MNRKGSAAFIALIVIVVVLAAAGVWYYEAKANLSESPVVISPPIPDVTPTQGNTAIYMDDQYGFQISYPAGWYVTTSTDKNYSLVSFSSEPIGSSGPDNPIPEFDLAIYNNNRNLSASNWANETFGSAIVGNISTGTLPDGIEYVSFKTGNPISTTVPRVTIANSQYVFDFTASSLGVASPSSSDYQNQYKEFNTLVSSFSYTTNLSG